MGLGSQPVKSSSSERLKWDQNRVLFFTHMLLDQQRKGKKDNNRWNPESWAFMVKEFEKRFQQSVTDKQLKAYVQVMKQEYGVIREMKNHISFVWNHAQKRLETTNYVWNDYLKTHREAKKWRTLAIPYYEEWFELFDGGTIANYERQPSSLLTTKTFNQGDNFGVTTANYERQPSSLPTAKTFNQGDSFGKNPSQAYPSELDKQDHSTPSSPPLPTTNMDLSIKRRVNEEPIKLESKKPRAKVINFRQTTQAKAVKEECKIMREAVPASLCMIKEATQIVMSMSDLTPMEKAKMSNRVREGNAFVCFLEMDAETRKEWVKLELGK